VESKKEKIYFLSDKKTLTILLLFVCAIFIFGCTANHYLMYNGPKRPSNEVAILTSYRPVHLLKIDEKITGHGAYNYGWVGSCIVELEPGYHDIVVQTYKVYCTTSSMSGGYGSGGYSYGIETTSIKSEEKELRFLFESGKIYQIIETSGKFHIIKVKKIPPVRKPYDEKNRIEPIEEEIRVMLKPGFLYFIIDDGSIIDGKLRQVNKKEIFVEKGSTLITIRRDKLVNIENSDMEDVTNQELSKKDFKRINYNYYRECIDIK